MERNLSNIQKKLKTLYGSYTRVGKILLVAAVVSFVWLLAGLINTIFNIVDLNLGIVGFILNVVAVVLVLIAIIQAVTLNYIMEQNKEAYREMVTQGRRRGHMVQNQGRPMTRSGKRPQTFISGHLSVDNINQKYPARWYKRATTVSDWKDIQEPGVFTLDSDSSQKVEIIDAKEIGGGYFVGTWEGNRFFKYKRQLILNKKTGRPQSYSSLRNAKKQLAKLD